MTTDFRTVPPAQAAGTVRKSLQASHTEILTPPKIVFTFVVTGYA